MNKLKNGLSIIALSLFMASCADQGEERGKSTQIDSTNIHGTAPATYGGDDPADDQKPQVNVDDTGTNAKNVSNNGDPENQVKKPQ